MKNRHFCHMRILSMRPGCHLLIMILFFYLKKNKWMMDRVLFSQLWLSVCHNKIVLKRNRCDLENERHLKETDGVINESLESVYLEV